MPAKPTKPRADRRPVTVVFADLSGFTALAEQLDPEDVRALQSDLYNEMSATILHFDGFVEKYIGDAVMAVFGAPVAHDEDPERAVRAALAMQQRIAALSETMDAARSASRWRCTSASTPGRWSPGTSDRTAPNAYAVTGDTVNAASRLQNAAGPGRDRRRRVDLRAHTTCVRVRAARRVVAQRQGAAAGRLTVSMRRW